MERFSKCYKKTIKAAANFNAILKGQGQRRGRHYIDILLQSRPYIGVGLKKASIIGHVKWYNKTTR